MAQLPYVVAGTLLFFVDLALAGDGQHPIVDRDLYVLGLHAGHLGPNYNVPVPWKHVHGGGPLSRSLRHPACRSTAKTTEHLVEQAVDLAVRIVESAATPEWAQTHLFYLLPF